MFGICVRSCLIVVTVLSGFNLSWAGSAVFDYNDFGPQALAYETIGFQWYQWNNVGDCDPSKIDPIKVVVFWNESLAAIREKFPVNPKKKQDYRYLSYQDAINYLNSVLSEYKELSNLMQTKEKLIQLKHYSTQ